MRWYRLDLNPEPWAIGAVGAGRRGGKITPYVGRNQQLFAYQEAVREELRIQGAQLIEGDIALEFYFWRQVAAYRTDADRLVRKNHADYTNLVKGTEDALQGVLFDNDRQVVGTGGGRIMAQGPDVEPRVLVGVAVAERWGLEDLPAGAFELIVPKGPELPFDDDSMSVEFGSDGEVPF